MRMRWVAAVLLVVALLVSGCTATGGSLPSNVDSKLAGIVGTYTFNLAGWEAGSVFSEIKDSIFHRQPDSVLTSQSVLEYFSTVSRINQLKSQLETAPPGQDPSSNGPAQTDLNALVQRTGELKPIAEQTIAGQISNILAEHGIYNPLDWDWFKINFPPVNFKLEDPLNELVISPRDKIQRIKSITLNPDMTAVQMEQVESALFALGVSALVIQIGGLGATYPAFVANDTDLQWTLETAAHEWVHQYLAFKPLGFRYVLDLLGVASNSEIETINETVADLVGQEIGSEVYTHYYAQYETEVTSRSTPAPVFDANAALRDIRRQVDAYLAAGQIDQAESYMDQQQQYLAGQGYYIRKLNQAYFAFYGTYADSGTSIDPTGAQLKSLRAHSLSIKDFLAQAANLTSAADLKTLINQLK